MEDFEKEPLTDFEKEQQKLDNETKDFIMTGTMVPKPPKPGETIFCQWCGKPMPIEDFSKDPYKRKLEFKWQIHWKCRLEWEDECDKRTPGLLKERRKDPYYLYGKRQ
jgi:hypothetical protein